MTETTKARLHRLFGGFVCAKRGRHKLGLVDHVWHERTGVSYETPIDGLPGKSITLHETQQHREQRLICLTCWQMPAD